jgi:hypothetical protein
MTEIENENENCEWNKNKSKADFFVMYGNLYIFYTIYLYISHETAVQWKIKKKPSVVNI